MHFLWRMIGQFDFFIVPAAGVLANIALGQVAWVDLRVRWAARNPSPGGHAGQLGDQPSHRGCARALRTSTAARTNLLPHHTALRIRCAARLVGQRRQRVSGLCDQAAGPQLDPAPGYRQRSR